MLDVKPNKLAVIEVKLQQLENTIYSAKLDVKVAEECNLEKEKKQAAGILKELMARKDAILKIMSEIEKEVQEVQNAG